MEDPAVTLPTAGTPLKTVGQSVWVEGDTINIKYGIMYYGFLGQKRVPIENIKTVSWKEPGLMAGFLELSILGEAPPHPSASANVQHQNRFIFPREDIARWQALKTWIESKMSTRTDPERKSIADELGKLGELLKSGLLTQAEFDAQKAKLLR